nr:MAG TPA: hypothetical protein [Bacteriophage sp.]
MYPNISPPYIYLKHSCGKTLGLYLFRSYPIRNLLHTNNIITLANIGEHL